MDNKQLLDAIQSIVQDIVQKETSELRGEMEARFTSIDARFTSLEARIDRQSSENKTLHENTFDRIKNLLHEDYERVAGAAAKGAAVAESHHELQSTVNTHEKVLQSHNDRLSVLEEKAI